MIYINLMSFYENNNLSQKSIQSGFKPYNYKTNYPITNTSTQKASYIRKGLYTNPNRSFITRTISQNNLINLYLKKNQGDKSSNIYDNHSYYKNINTNQINPNNYNSYYSNAIYKSPIQYKTKDNIYPKNNMINYSNDILQEIQRNIEIEGFAKVIPIETGYNDNSNSFSKNDIFSTTKQKEIYYSSTPQSSYSNIKYNSYINYPSKRKNEINYPLNNEIALDRKIESSNNNINQSTNANININTLDELSTNKTNILTQINNKNDIKERNITTQYINQGKDLDNYKINSPNKYGDADKLFLYQSFIYKSPEITLKKNLFSPIETPLANYETQSYNGDENFNIEKMVKLKEENEKYKQQLKEFDIYKEKAAEARELRKQLEQLSPLKEKLAEIDSLKSQLKEFNELKAKIEQLEKFQYQLEEKEISEKIEEIKLMKKFHHILLKAKGKDKAIWKKEQNKKIVKHKEKNKEIKKKKSNIEKTNDDNEPEFVKGEIIHNIKELGMIIKHINNESQQIILNLLYKASSDSDRAKVFHKKCDNAKSSIVLIETDKGKRFGGYTSVNWKGKCIKKIDRDSFIFSLDNMKVYKNIIGEKAIGCYPKFGPIFLGCQIKIYDNAFKKGGSTFKKGLNFDTDEDYVLTGGDRLFKIKELEVYEIITQ